jgi:hypothetical protein
MNFNHLDKIRAIHKSLYGAAHIKSQGFCCNFSMPRLMLMEIHIPIMCGRRRAARIATIAPIE